MKKLLLLFALLTGFIFAQNVRVQDYEVPVSQAKNLRFNGNWDWQQLGDSVTSNNINSNLFFRMFYSSLPLAWFINIDADGFKVKDSLGHNIRLNARFNKYIWPNEDVFGFVNFISTHAHIYKEIASNLTVGFGYGRYINATPLAKAVRIEEHLIREKVITGYMPKDVMINIANIIEKENEFRSLYGEVYETYWLDAIEDEIRKSGQLEDDNIGSIGILRTRQVLFNINEIVNPRYYGWDVSAGILFPITTGYKTSTGNPNFSLGGRYSLPLSWRIQINTVAQVYTPIDSSFAKEVSTELGIDLIYEFSNRINFLNNYRIEAFKPENTRVRYSHILQSAFWFYLENNISLTITGTFRRTSGSRSILSTNIGLQYNLF